MEWLVKRPIGRPAFRIDQFTELPIAKPFEAPSACDTRASTGENITAVAKLWGESPTRMIYERDEHSRSMGGGSQAANHSSSLCLLHPGPHVPGKAFPTQDILLGDCSTRCSQTPGTHDGPVPGALGIRAAKADAEGPTSSRPRRRRNGLTMSTLSFAACAKTNIRSRPRFKPHRHASSASAAARTTQAARPPRSSRWQ